MGYHPITANSLAALIRNRELRCQSIMCRATEHAGHAQTLLTVHGLLESRFGGDHRWHAAKPDLESLHRTAIDMYNRAANYQPTIGADIHSFKTAEDSIEKLDQFDRMLHSIALGLKFTRDRMIEDAGQTAYENACIRAY